MILIALLKILTIIDYTSTVQYYSFFINFIKKIVYKNYIINY